MTIVEPAPVDTPPIDIPPVDTSGSTGGIGVPLAPANPVPPITLTNPDGTTETLTLPQAIPAQGTPTPVDLNTSGLGNMDTIRWDSWFRFIQNGFQEQLVGPPAQLNWAGIVNAFQVPLERMLQTFATHINFLADFMQGLGEQTANNAYVSSLIVVSLDQQLAKIRKNYGGTINVIVKLEDFVIAGADHRVPPVRLSARARRHPSDESLVDREHLHAARYRDRDRNPDTSDAGEPDHPDRSPESRIVDPGEARPGRRDRRRRARLGTEDRPVRAELRRADVPDDGSEHRSRETAEGAQHRGGRRAHRGSCWHERTELAVFFKEAVAKLSGIVGDFETFFSPGGETLGGLVLAANRQGALRCPKV